MRPPELDSRGLEEILAEGRALAERYCAPDWTGSADPRDPGGALIALCARLVDLLAERVNRVPEKNLLAFLDTVGVERSPGAAAEVPVTFLLPETAKEGQLVPAGTQVATTQTEEAPVPVAAKS